MKMLLWISAFSILQGCSPFRQTAIDREMTRTSTKAHPMNNKDRFLEELMIKQVPLFADVLRNRNAWNVQVIYTRIDRDRKGRPSFTEHSFNLTDDNYFYPASTVKLPVAVLALQRLNELKIAGLDKHSIMLTGSDGEGQTGVDTDSTAVNGLPCIAQYTRKILLVSDNDAFNRLYEFLGQEYINNSLHKMGYDDVQIIHRLDISLTEEQHRHTNPVRFLDTEGKTIYEKPAAKSKLVYAERADKLGKGYMKDGQLVNQPFDFSKKNRISLNDLNSILRSIVFPESMPASQRFNLTRDDYIFLRKYMSMLPAESDYPRYEQSEFGSAYAKHWMYGKKDTAEAGIRIFNKAGWAYGYLSDVAYVADFKNGVEFMISAVIYCNEDSIFNDNKYDYDTIGYPFFKNLGRAVYDYELGRERRNRSIPAEFKFDYR